MTTVLVTGANRGIGHALAEALARRGDGVIGTYRSDHPALDIDWQKLDVADETSHRQLAQRLSGRPLDLVVCNAGVYLEKHGDYAAIQWANTFAVNVTGVYLTVAHLLPAIRAAKGKIAIIASNMGAQARAPGGSYIYRSSKAATLNLGRNLASDLRRDGIAVGIYHPGWVVTDMGGQSADIDVGKSASGLITRFAALNLSSTGCFESYDGTVLNF